MIPPDRSRVGEVRDGDFCRVVGGAHKGKSGIARDLNTSKTGHVTLTIVQPDGQRFKTLARNVVVAPDPRP